MLVVSEETLEIALYSNGSAFQLTNFSQSIDKYNCNIDNIVAKPKKLYIGPVTKNKVDAGCEQTRTSESRGTQKRSRIIDSAS